MEQFKNAKITPMAYIESFAGIKFIIKIEIDGEISYTKILPPNYEIEKEYPEGLLASAVAKHDFTFYQGKTYSYEEYRDELKALQEELLGE